MGLVVSICWRRFNPFFFFGLDKVYILLVAYRVIGIQKYSNKPKGDEEKNETQKIRRRNTKHHQRTNGNRTNQSNNRTSIRTGTKRRPPSSHRRCRLHAKLRIPENRRINTNNKRGRIKKHSTYPQKK